MGKKFRLEFNESEFKGKSGTWKNNYRLAAKLISPKRGWLMLDAGCGKGFLAHFLPYGRLVGMDMSKEALTSARRQHRYSRLVLCRIQKMPFPSDYFDAAFCLTVLNANKLNGKWKKLLSEIIRVVRKGGKIVFDFEWLGRNVKLFKFLRIV